MIEFCHHRGSDKYFFMTLYLQAAVKKLSKSMWSHTFLSWSECMDPTAIEWEFLIFYCFGCILNILMCCIIIIELKIFPFFFCGLNNKDFFFFPHISRAWKVQVQSAGRFRFWCDGLFLACRQHSSSLCLCMVEGARVLSGVSFIIALTPSLPIDPNF